MKTKKRILQKLLSVLLAVTLFITASEIPPLKNIFTAFATPTTGWADNYATQTFFEINSLSDYEALVSASSLYNFENKVITLNCDLTISQSAFSNGSYPLKGIFYGNGHTITTSVTVFKNTDIGTIKNLNVIANTTMKSALIDSSSHTNIIGCTTSGTVSATTSTDTYVGGFISRGSANIKNCINNVNVYGGSYATSVGGFIGQSSGNTAISSSINNGTVSSLTNSSNSGVGGFIGDTGGITLKLSIKNSINNGEISVNSANVPKGGFVGYYYYQDNSNKSEIANCLSIGKINTVGTNSGAFIGNLINIPTISFSYYNSDVISCGAVKNSSDISESTYYSTKKNTSFLTSAVADDIFGVPNENWSYVARRDFSGNGSAYESFYPLPSTLADEINFISVVTNSTGNPLSSPVTYISNEAELSSVTGSGTYILTSDLTLSGSYSAPSGFSGTFYGNNHTITLNNAPAVFASTANGARIDGLVLKGTGSQNASLINSANNIALRNIVNYTDKSIINQIASDSTSSEISRCASYVAGFVSTLSGGTLDITNSFSKTAAFVDTGTANVTDCWADILTTSSFSPSSENAENWTSTAAQTVNGVTKTALPTLKNLYCEPIVVTSGSPAANTISDATALNAAILAGGNYILGTNITEPITPADCANNFTLDCNGYSIATPIIGTVSAGTTVNITNLLYNGSSALIAQATDNTSNITVSGEYTGTFDNPNEAAVGTENSAVVNVTGFTDVSLSGSTLTPPTSSFTTQITVYKPIPISVFSGTLTQTYETASFNIGAADFSGLSYSHDADLDESSNIIVPTLASPGARVNPTITTSYSDNKIALVNGSTDTVSLAVLYNGGAESFTFESMADTTVINPDTDTEYGIAGIAYDSGDGLYKISALNKGKTRVKVTVPQSDTHNAGIFYIEVEVGTGTLTASNFTVNTSIPYSGNFPANIIESNVNDVTITYKLSDSPDDYAATVPSVRNVGTYSLLYKAEKSGYTTYDPVSPISITITKANPVSFLFNTTVQENEFTGSPAIITAVPSLTLLSGDSYVSASEISYKYRLNGSSDAFESGLPTERGEYEVKAVFTPSATNGVNYNAAETSNSLVLTIGYAVFGVSVANNTVTYDGQPHSISVSGVPADSSVEYSLNNMNFYSSLSDPAFGRSFIDAGSKTVYVRVYNPNYNNGAAKVYSASLTINKETPDVALTLADSYSIAYEDLNRLDDDMRDGLVTTLVGGEIYSGDYDFSYSTDSLTWHDGLPTSVGSGTYYVRACPSELSDNYNSQYSNFVEITVTPSAWRDSLVSYNPEAHFTYNGLTQLPTISVPAGSTIKYSLTQNGTYSTAGSFNFKNATPPAGTIVYFRVTNQNYSGIGGADYYQGSVRVYIEQASLTVSFVNGYQCLTYGHISNVTAPSVSNFITGEEGTPYTISYKYRPYNDPSAAFTLLEDQELPVGEYLFEPILTFTGPIKNYKVAVTSQLRLYVAPASFNTVSATEINKVYDGIGSSIVVTVPSNSTITYSSSIDGVYSATNPVYSDAISTVLYYKVENENYEAVNGYNYYLGVTTINIRKVQPSINFSPSTNNFTFTGLPVAVTASITSGGSPSDVIEFSYTVVGGTGVNAGVHSGLPTAVGSYVITASIPEIMNYFSATNAKNITINPAPFPSGICTIPSDVTATYNAGKAINIPFENVPEGTVISYSDSAAGPFASLTYKNAMPETTVYYKITNPNYNGQITGNFKLTIEKANPILTNLTASDISFGSYLKYSSLKGTATFVDTTGQSHSVNGSLAWSSPETSPSCGAGYFNCVFTPYDSANYNTVTAQVLVRIDKGFLKITLPDSQVKYTGSPILPSVLNATISPNGLSVNNIIYSYRIYGSKGSFKPGLPTDIGIYEVKAEYTHQDYEGKPVTAKISIYDSNVVIKNYEGSYDGKSHSISVKIPSDATIVYKVAGKSQTTEKPSFTDIGVYNIDYVVTLKNGKNVKGTASVTITTKYKENGNNASIEISGGNKYIDNITAEKLSSKTGTLMISLESGFIWVMNCSDAKLANKLDFNAKYVENVNSRGEKYYRVIFSKQVELGFNAGIVLNVGSGLNGEKFSLYEVNGRKMRLVEELIAENGIIRFMTDSTEKQFYITLAGDENPLFDNNTETDTKNPETGVSMPSMSVVVCSAAVITSSAIIIRKKQLVLKSQNQDE